MVWSAGRRWLCVINGRFADAGFFATNATLTIRKWPENVADRAGGAALLMAINLRYEFGRAVLKSVEAAISLPRLISSAESLIEPEHLGKRFADALFEHWYRHSSYFVVFSQSAEITNIQFAEFRALVERHARKSGSPHDEDWRAQIVSPTTISRQFVAAWNDSVGASIRVREGQEKKRAETIAALIMETIDSDLERISSFIVLDPYQCSCAIMYSRVVEMDWAVLVAESGYIHNAGQLVYNSLMKRAEVAHLAAGIYHTEKSLRPTNTSAYKASLAIFSHEAFPEASSEGFGIQRFYESKDYIQNDSIRTAIQKMMRRPLPGGGLLEDIVSLLPLVYNDKNVGATPRAFTFWVLREQRYEDPPNENRLICYVQTLKNSNPFIRFDESKPAWVAPVTIPQRLAGAMFNIARTTHELHANAFCQKKGEPVRIADPFCGSGTFSFESFKWPGTEFYNSDINPVSRLLVEDNLWFFGLSDAVDELDNLHKKINVCINDFSKAKDLGGANDVDLRRSLAILEKILSSYINKDKREVFDVRRMREHAFLNSEDFSDFAVGENRVCRILFWLAWRACLNNAHQLIHEGETPHAVVLKEMEKFQSQIKKLIKVRRERSADNDWPTPPWAALQDGVGFSRETIITARAISKDAQRILDRTICGQDGDFYSAMRTQAAIKPFDIIITDPPYGFNTKPHSAKEQFEMFKEILTTFYESLGRFGQVIIALPETSVTGQSIPLYLRRRWIVPQFISIATERGGRVIQVATLKPMADDLWSLPYYWKSKRALTRVIVHFIVVKNNHT